MFIYNLEQNIELLSNSKTLFHPLQGLTQNSKKEHVPEPRIIFIEGHEVEHYPKFSQFPYYVIQENNIRKIFAQDNLEAEIIYQKVGGYVKILCH